MNAGVLWCAAIAAMVVAFVLELALGSTNLTIAAAIVATGLVILAAIVEGPPTNDRRPW